MMGLMRLQERIGMLGVIFPAGVMHLELEQGVGMGKARVESVCIKVLRMCSYASIE